MIGITGHKSIMLDWASTIINGILTGGLYAMLATGLAIIFGVMRLVNITHGDLIVLAAFIAMVVMETTGADPFVSLMVVVPVMLVAGYLLQRGILNYTIGDDLLPPLLVTFGLSIVLQNLLLEIFSADSQRLPAGPVEAASIEVLPGLQIGVFPLIIFVVAVALIFSVQILFNRTRLGRAFRATSDDLETAQLMGIDHKHIYSLAMAISLGLIAVAGIFLGIRTTFDPSIGPSRLLFAFEAVIIGGLGSIWGTLVGGIILGLAQNIGAKINPGWQILAGHIAFLCILVIRPNGFFPRTRDE